MSDYITLVSGLPRSGTSMMMRMLEAGGMDVLTDHIREPDEDNPLGYYEYERVKEIERDASWLEEARGKAVKMVSALLVHLPPQHTYKVILMRREMAEILASQRRMLARRGEPANAAADQRMADLFERHLRQVLAWLDQQPNIQVLEVSYNEVLHHPLRWAKRVRRFLGRPLDVKRMAQVVEPSLYRQRK